VKTARLSRAVARLFERERICRVATAGPGGMPHLVPVCQVVSGGKIYFASGNDGRKALNLAANPRVALTIDLYSDDWTHIKGVMVQGRARLYPRGPRFKTIRALLYTKYPQYAREAALDESDSVVIEVTPTRVFTWGMK
jgi:PPOX class probable F420-dependent enzyme